MRKKSISEFEEGRNQLQEKINEIKNNNTLTKNEIMPKVGNFERDGWKTIANVVELVLKQESKTNILEEKVDYLMEQDKKMNDKVSPAQLETINRLVDSEVDAILQKMKLKGKKKERFYRSATTRIMKGAIKKYVGANKWCEIKSTDYERIIKTIIPAMYKEIKSEDIEERGNRYASTYDEKIQKFAQEAAKNIEATNVVEMRFVANDKN